MGLFGSRKVKIGVLSNNDQFTYQVPKSEVNPSGLAKHLACTKVQDRTVSDVSVVPVGLQTEREQGGRHNVRIFGWGGEDLAVINDRGLWTAVVIMYGRLRLNGVRTNCRVSMYPSSATGLAGLQDICLDLPSGFPADIKSSPHFLMVEEALT